jgi:hypothetical protein
MADVSLSGKDAIVINGRIFNDFADGDVANLTFPNDLANVKASKDGNLIFAFNETGRICNFALRVLIGSADDKYLNSLMQSMKSDFSGFNVLTGTFVKRIGDGKGNITNSIYVLSGGVFKKQPEQKNNVEGDTSQSVVVYELLFGNGNRNIA